AAAIGARLQGVAGGRRRFVDHAAKRIRERVFSEQNFNDACAWMSGGDGGRRGERARESGARGKLRDERFARRFGETGAGISRSRARSTIAPRTRREWACLRRALRSPQTARRFFRDARAPR